MNRRYFLKTAAASLAFKAIPGFAKDVLASPVSIENSVITYFEQFGITNPENLTETDLVLLTNLDPHIQTPLAILWGEIRRNPQRPFADKFRSNLFTSEKKIMSKHYKIASTLIESITEHTKGLPADAPLSRNIWNKYLDARYHIAYFRQSLHLFPNFYQQRNEEQKNIVSAWIEETEQRIAELESLDGYKRVESGVWDNNQQRQRPYDSGVEGNVELDSTQKRYRDLIIQRAESYPDQGVKDGIDTLLWIVHCESLFDPSAKNPDSTASGLFQIVRRTWNYIKTLDPSLQGYEFEANRFNPEINIRFGLTLYAKEGTPHWEWSRNCWGSPVEQGLRFPRG